MQDFGDIEVVQLAHRFVLKIYRVSGGFPKSERYELTSQLRRASSSVPANIAEGCGLQGRAQLRRFVYNASGSASEVQYWLRLAHDLEYLSKTDYDELRRELLTIRKKLTRFIQSLS